MNESQNSINKMSYLRFALDKFWERILSGGANTLKFDGQTKKKEFLSPSQSPNAYDPHS